MAEPDLALGVFFLGLAVLNEELFGAPSQRNLLGQFKMFGFLPIRLLLGPAQAPSSCEYGETQREGGGTRVCSGQFVAGTGERGPGGRTPTDASARANADRSPSAPHRAGRKPEAIAPVGRRDERQFAGRLRRAEEETALSLHVRIAWPPYGHDVPLRGSHSNASPIICTRWPAARKTADDVVAAPR